MDGRAPIPECTLAQPGIGDGRGAASFDGVTSYNNIYSAALISAFNGAQGAISDLGQGAERGRVVGRHKPPHDSTFRPMRVTGSG